jgi:hypothetical protein
MRVESQKKLESEKTQVYVQKPRLKMLFKYSTSGNVPKKTKKTTYVMYSMLVPYHLKLPGEVSNVWKV